MAKWNINVWLHRTLMIKGHITHKVTVKQKPIIEYLRNNFGMENVSIIFYYFSFPIFILVEMIYFIIIKADTY